MKSFDLCKKIQKIIPQNLLFIDPIKMYECQKMTIKLRQKKYMLKDIRTFLCKGVFRAVQTIKGVFAAVLTNKGGSLYCFWFLIITSFT